MTGRTVAAKLAQGSVILALALCFSVAAGGAEPGQGTVLPASFVARPAAPYDLVRSDIYIPVADGTRLAASIYRPAKAGQAVAGKFPVIFNFTAARQPLQATNADRSGGGRISQKMPELARYGYVFIDVERRGMSASFGVRRGYHPRAEAQDSQFLIRWSATQPWSNGIAGVYGCSNTGDAAMHVLTIAPAPANLKAVFAGCFNWDKYDGGFAGMLFNWGTGPDFTAEQDFQAAVPVDGDSDRRLLRQATDEHRGSTSLLQLWKSMPYRDTVSPLVGTAFWQEGSISTYAKAVTGSGVPIFILDGWNDDFRGQALIAFANLKQAKTVLIGPWGHCETGTVDVFAEALGFFNHYLKGAAYAPPPPVRYFLQNAPAGTEWRSAARWPVPGSHLVSQYFLGGAGGSDHAVQTASPVQDQPASFKTDTALECKDTQFLGNTCPQDGKGASFTSAVQSADLKIIGDPVAEIWASADRSDARLFAYLEDVAPDGKATVITDGRIRAALRKTGKAPWNNLDMPWRPSKEADLQPLTPGQPVLLRIGLLPTAYVIKPGHRWRLNVTGADIREKLRPDESGSATWTIHAGGKLASRLILPQSD